MTSPGWPAELRPLCNRFSPRLVWLAGLQQLGCPPTWTIGGREILELTNYLTLFVS